MIAVLVLFCAIAISADAHVLSGYVFDSANKPLDVTVGIENETSYSVTNTDEEGYFKFMDVPTGYYQIFVNDETPILWDYTGAGIGYDTPLYITSDIQINFTLLEIYVSFETNASEYKNGDIIAINLTVENNDLYYDLIDWEVWAELWNETYEEFIDEDYYFVNISSGEIESFLLYIQIPYDNKYDRLYLDSGIWAIGIEFESSEGILEGELWNWYGIEINVTTAQEYTLSGYVFNSDNNPLANVPVELENETIWLINKTDSNGYFEFSNLPQGEYESSINQGYVYPSLEEYTVISLEDDFTKMINLTDDLEINVTLLKIDAKLELLGKELPKFIDIDYIESAKIDTISKFRSGIGHDYSDSFESCRSMKHYFVPNNSIDWSKIKIFSPVTGTITRVYEEWAGTQLQIRPTNYPDYTIIIFHINLTNPMNVGDNVTAAQQLGTHAYPGSSDIAIGVNTPKGWKLVSYFDVMTNNLFNVYKARGVGSRDVMITSKEERDSDPLTCVGEEFTNSGNLENWIFLGMQYPPKENPKTYTYWSGDTIEANVTVTNNENFALTDWAFVSGVNFENETYHEQLHINLTPTNISAEETKSQLFTYEIPENNTYDELYFFGGTGYDNYDVESSQGTMKALTFKVDTKKISIIEKTKFNISLKKGWNLVSVPLVLPNPILPAPLKSIEGNYSAGYAYIDGVWRQYLAGEPPSSKEIEPTMGFWINMTNDDVLEVEGYEPSKELDLNQGWNLIGYPFLNEMNASDVVNYMNFAIVYSYNGSWLSYVPDRSFNSLNTMKPGYGYWVKIE